MAAFIVIVTGASRGIGRCMALELCQGLADAKPACASIAFALLSRDAAGMAETASLLAAAAGTVPVHVEQEVVDLADLDAVEPAFASVWGRAAAHAATAGAPVSTFLINNAGSLGETNLLVCVPVAPSQSESSSSVHRVIDASKRAPAACRDLSGVAAVRSAIDLSVTSYVWLTSLYLKKLRGLATTAATAAMASATASSAPTGGSAAAAGGNGSGAASGGRHAVVNVSSLCAVKAFPSQALYCTGKAGRDMVVAMVAAEAAATLPPPGSGSSSGSTLTALNYAPGPCDTDMQSALRASATLDAGLRDAFRGMKEGGTLVDAAVSARKCVRRLLLPVALGTDPAAYASGAHVDYYDLP